MRHFELKERLQLIPMVWGLSSGLVLLLMSRQPNKGVIPLVIGSTFLCSLIAHWFRERKTIRVAATIGTLVLAGATGYLCFHYPLPFA